MQNPIVNSASTLTATSGATAPASQAVADILNTAPSKAAQAKAKAASNRASRLAEKQADAAQAAKPTPPKPNASDKPARNVRKPKQPVTATPAPAPLTYHAESGIKSSVSRLRNANRVTSIFLCADKSPSQISADKKTALYDLRKAYAKPFPARGLDNGILRDLIAAKLIKATGGVSATKNGKPYLIDGEKPVMLSITKAGQTYGKA